MNVLEKIKRSWWVILSFIMFLNGVGFIYIGSKHKNRNWIIEGIIYEIPWIFTFIMAFVYPDNIQTAIDPVYLTIVLAISVLFISIVRSVWVAVKLADVYDNIEKYSIQSTVLDGNSNKKDDNLLSNCGCCLCIIAVFILFLMAVL